jgi:hypothetical protein
MVSFAFVLPLLVALSLAILEFTVIMFDYHRASEATRRGARLATILVPAGDLSGLTAGTPVTCGAGGGALSCGGAGIQSQASFDAVIARMQEILPAISAANVEVSYSLSGIGDASTPGGVLPLVTVSLTNLQYQFIVLSAVPGMPDAITYLPFTTSYLAGGNDVSP